ncbi:MAG: fibronectin type III domain-containing protein [Acidimicrobiia bacterium]
MTVFQSNKGSVEVAFTGDGLAGATFAVSCTSTTGASFTKSGLSQSASPVATKGLGTDAPLSAPGVTPVVYNVVTCNVTETSPSQRTSPAGTGTDALIQTSGPGCQPSATVAAPTNISAAAQGFPGAVVSWAPVATDCLVGYLVTPSSGKAVLVLGPGTTTVMQGPYADGILIQFTVAAVTGAGVGPGSVGVGVTIGTPAAPQSVTASRAGKGAIKVAFEAGASNGAAITGLTARCGLHSASGKASPLTVKGLTTGKSYNCTVAATNSRGTGASARFETAKA